MAEITFFVALPFDFVDSNVAADEPIDCPSPDAAIQRAQGLWKVLGRAGGDEMGERVGLVIDGVDGRVHHVEMDAARAEEVGRLSPTGLDSQIGHAGGRKRYREIANQAKSPRFG